ncbi:MAG: endo-1,4-beta-xylanase Z [Bacteroidaceae bacterium]|nr:endo-1,4-beta-xylanase Z [Bacteroidaceae bacterium]MBR3718068.1 endo-1,4-beta-xylanase Z [Bacteroidaceae bacterium]
MKSKALLLGACLLMAGSVSAQFQRTPTPNDTLHSVTVNPDNTVIFRLYAPDAKSVNISGDIVPWGKPTTFTKQANGVWEGKVENDKVGAFRYNFVVDGMQVDDPKALFAGSLKPVVDVDPAGNAFWQMKDVPHGATAEIYYKSSTFNTTRRAHVWTPAGYEKGTDKLPVLYLIHGGGDNDYAWPNVGRANFIMDNLLAEGKIVPMIVVMPDGSVDTDKFTDDMMNDLIPYIENNYRVIADAQHRALAGLSMGGLETLNVSLLHYKSFAYVFPLSTGWFEGSDLYAQWEPYLKEHAAEMNKAFKVYKFFMGGEEDIAYKNCIATRASFDKFGIKHEYSEMPGGHTWYVWRHNLRDLAPLCFR